MRWILWRSERSPWRWGALWRLDPSLCHVHHLCEDPEPWPRIHLIWIQNDIEPSAHDTRVIQNDKREREKEDRCKKTQKDSPHICPSWHFICGSRRISSLNANVLSVSCRFSVGIEGVSQPSGVLSIIIDRFEWPLLVPPRSRQPTRTPNRSTIRCSSSTELFAIGKVEIATLSLI